jgi:hypothetical protein
MLDPLGGNKTLGEMPDEERQDYYKTDKHFPTCCLVEKIVDAAKEKNY